MKPVKQFLKQCFPVQALRYRAYKDLIENENSYLYVTGWMQSLRGFAPIDPHGNPIPWMNYPVISFLEERLNDSLSLFEYGSGYSTMFYAQRVSDVVSVEYDQAWFEKVQETLPPNVDLVYQAEDRDGDYCRVIGTTGKTFDVIVVDGRDRVNCVKQSIAALSPRGVLLLDDSQRDNYTEAITYAQAEGFRVLHFEGLKATGNEIDRTTIFYRDGNCLGI